MEIKKDIEKDQGHSADMQKIIYAGRILKDDDTLEALKYQEADFMVLMVTKTPSAKKNEAPSREVDVTSKASGSTSAVESAETATKRIPEESKLEDYSESTLTTGGHYEAAVGRLMEMGFSRPQVVLAMRAAFNNPDRAVEYLVSGIPSHSGEGLSIPPVSPNLPRSPDAESGQSPSPDSGPANIFEVATEASRRIQPIPPEAFEWINSEGHDRSRQSANSLCFNQIRQMLASDPQMIIPILRQIWKSDPRLFQFLTNNQDKLFKLLGTEQGANSGASDSQSQSAAGYDPSSLYITTEENAAIERLSALGFERSLAIEAFFACDKNEELAASYLFNLGQGLN